jgi:NAD(P)-binding Rossmann-like domain
MQTIGADYLVVGAGAMGIAFTDALVSETDATVLVVDRGHQPGGHWTAAYPFVRLHQPSAFYGVNSRKLGSDTIDAVGWNKGLYELATGGEVCAYFDQVMQQQLLPTGRVAYFPMSEHHGDGLFSTLGGQDYTVTAQRAIVDATYLSVVVPSMRPPSFAVAPGVDCIPPNDLAKYAVGRDRYVIVGAGKTGMDACLWLLRHGVAADRLTWIKPREAWLLDRALLQPGPPFAKGIRAAMIARVEAIRNATSLDDLFGRLEATGLLLRVDPTTRPTMYRCATVSRAELEQLRGITNVLRLGHVSRIEHDKIVLDDGELRAHPSTLYIDCTANGLERRPNLPVFDGQRITLQCVRGCQPVFSAAVIGHVEATKPDVRAKNGLCAPVPYPVDDLDWLRMLIVENDNHTRWLDDPEMAQWLESSRLDMIAHLRPPIPPNPRVRDRALRLVKSTMQATTEQLEKLLSSVNS